MAQLRGLAELTLSLGLVRGVFNRVESLMFVRFHVRVVSHVWGQGLFGCLRLLHKWIGNVVLRCFLLELDLEVTLPVCEDFVHGVL